MTAREKKKVEVKHEKVQCQRKVVCFSDELPPPEVSLSLSNCLSFSLLLPSFSLLFSSHLRGHALDDVTRALQYGRQGGEASLFFSLHATREGGREEEGENVRESQCGRKLVKKEN